MRKAKSKPKIFRRAAANRSAYQLAMEEIASLLRAVTAAHSAKEGVAPAASPAERHTQMEAKTDGVNFPSAHVGWTTGGLPSEGSGTYQCSNPVLAQREAQYGSFYSVARKFRQVKGELEYGRGYMQAGPVEAQAFDMILLKLVRLSNGDMSHEDGWRDIAGYAELVVQEFKPVKARD